MNETVYELTGTGEDGGTWTFRSRRLDDVKTLQGQIGGSLSCNPGATEAGLGARPEIAVQTASHSIGLITRLSSMLRR